MILYRRQGDYKQELKTINRAIKILEEIFRKRQPAFNNTIRSLSSTIAKVTGLLYQKGNSLFQKGELGKWNMRKETVTKKIK